MHTFPKGFGRFPSDIKCKKEEEQPLLLLAAVDNNNNNNNGDSGAAAELSNFDGIVSACLTSIWQTLCSREFKTHHTRPCYLLAVKRLRNGRRTR